MKAIPRTINITSAILSVFFENCFFMKRVQLAVCPTITATIKVAMSMTKMLSPVIVVYE